MDDTAATPPVATADPATDPLRDALVAAIGEDYEVVRLIGRGGMGAVYLARDRALERLVAIKVLPPGTAADTALVERFRREAKTVASLQHPGIVPLYAFGERRGLCWFVMGYVRGESLSSRLERDGRVDSDTARTLLGQVAEALDHAHRQGIIHRDIKPDNVLLDDSTGRALLTDFGIARAESSLSATSLTQVGSVLGTPHYMSPEQASAEPTIDGRSDLYSVGVMAYQMLSGQLPFDGTNFRALVMQHLSATPKPLATVAPDVPRDLADAVMQCLEKEPAKRFADGRSLRTAIGGSTLDDESIGYELTDLKHGAAYGVMVFLLAGTFTLSALLAGGTFLGQRWWFHAGSPIFFFLYVLRVRQARQRGYDWAAIRRAVTAPPKWWFLWWPKQWRSPGDVFERLPRTLQWARMLTVVTMLLCLGEIPLIAYANHRMTADVRDALPALHAYAPVRWLGAYMIIDLLLGLICLLVALMGSLVIADLMARRVAKPLGLGFLDINRLVYSPTDSSFWRDPRIQPVIRRQVSEKRPTSPQEFVSQIVAGSGTATPFTTAASASAGTAARRLLDAVTTIEKEMSLLDKAAPAEQLDRLEAEVIALEADGADAESITLLEQQRAAVLRSRERIQRLAARRDDATARIEQLWSDLRRLKTSTDPDAARTLADAITAQCDAALADFPPRTRTATGAARTAVTAALLLLCATGALATQQAASGAPAAALAMVQRGQPDSAIAALEAVDARTPGVATATGTALLWKGSTLNELAAMGVARRSRAAFERAVAADSTDATALASLFWLKRLLPWYLGGNDARAADVLAALQRVSPYHGRLMTGYRQRLDGQTAAAAATFAALTAEFSDSAAVWFARGDLASATADVDDALAAFRRYRELRPDDRTGSTRFATVAARNGVALEEAERVLRDYLRVKPNPVELQEAIAWWRLGQVLEKQGRLPDARAAYTKALTLEPKDRDYRMSLDSLALKTAP
jgi:tetratricopeptide (TPR) repeat protein/predicted Ser/Thr protein kinase